MSQGWGGGDGWTPEAYWPVSLAELLNSRQLRDPVSKSKALRKRPLLTSGLPVCVLMPSHEHPWEHGPTSAPRAPCAPTHTRTHTHTVVFELCPGFHLMLTVQSSLVCI